MFPHREHVVAVRVPAGAVPDGMFISAGSPTRSVRATPYGEDVLLIISGESHKTGEDPDTDDRYRRLLAWAEEEFPVTGVEYRWSAQDNYSADGVPYVGRYTRTSQHLYTATGFGAWGMTNGTLAGMLLSDAILGRENPWAQLYDSNRIKPLASGATVFKENTKVAAHFVGDRIAARGKDARQACSRTRRLSSTRAAAPSPPIVMPTAHCTPCPPRAPTRAASCRGTRASAAGTARATAHGSRATAPCFTVQPSNHWRRGTCSCRVRRWGEQAQRSQRCSREGWR